jgi:glutamate-1-semialdehyde 2,1-aminomutase
VLVFDETITGFRFANGGAQELFGVTPDLASFGKGIANGYPLSAVTGRRDIMMEMEEVFFSFTFGGELLSLAAAKATLTMLREKPVLDTIKRQGEAVVAGVQALLDENGLSNQFVLKGHPSWTFLVYPDQPTASAFEIKTFMMQEFHQCGVLGYGTHNLSLAHGDAELETLFNAYRHTLPLLREALTEGNLKDRLRCDPLIPLFKVR